MNNDKINEYVARLLADAPRLDDERRERIASIFGGVAGIERVHVAA